MRTIKKQADQEEEISGLAFEKTNDQRDHSFFMLRSNAHIYSVSKGMQEMEQ